MAATEAWVRQERLSELMGPCSGQSRGVHFPDDRGQLLNAIPIGILRCGRGHGLSNRSTPTGEGGGDHVAQDPKAVVVVVKVEPKLSAQLVNIVEVRPFCLVCVWGGAGLGLRVQRHVAVGVLLTEGEKMFPSLGKLSKLIRPAPCNGGGAGGL